MDTGKLLEVGRKRLSSIMFILFNGVFYNENQLKNEITKLEFSWVGLSELKDINIYPEFSKEKVLNLSDHIEHFIIVE